MKNVTGSYIGRVRERGEPVLTKDPLVLYNFKQMKGFAPNVGPGVKGIINTSCSESLGRPVYFPQTVLEN